MVKVILSVTITLLLLGSATGVASIAPIRESLSGPGVTSAPRAEIALGSRVSVSSNLTRPSVPADSTESCFTPPLVINRRRAAHPAPACADTPTLTIIPSREAVPFGEMVTVNWTASQPGARVCIEGIGSELASRGSVTVPVFRRIDFHGRATTCNPGPGVTASVNLCQPSDGAILATSTSIPIGGTTTLSIVASGLWSLSSSLGNTLSRSSGFGAATVVFTGKTVGLDPLLLVVATECDTISRGITIEVTGMNPEP